MLQHAIVKDHLLSVRLYVT